MLRLDMLPARHGDCLWLEYGDPARPFRVLIDGGTVSTWRRLKARIDALPVDDRRFELLIVSHIDADHIGGALKLLARPPAGLSIGDVWFNGFRHLPTDELGVRQAEKLSRELIPGRFPWNGAFGGEAAVVPDAGPLPSKALAGGLELILLSPGVEQLTRLQPVWEKERAKLGIEEREKPREEPDDLLGEGLDVAALAAAPFQEDTAEANGSSLAVLVRYEGRALLLGADAFPGVLAAAVDRLLIAEGDSQLRLEAFKVCHHGSRSNTSRQLLQKLDCRHYLISTDGSLYHHPDREAIARLLVHGGSDKTLHFNYRTERNEIWDDEPLKRRYRYETRYAAAGESLAFPG